MLSDTKIFRVGSGKAVTLDVEYGEGDPGGTSTLWNGSKIDVPQGVAVTFDNGGSPVRGILNCRSNVKDLNSQTNRTSVTYHLSGGPQPQQFTYAIEVPNQGDIAEYAINFVFL